MAPSSIKCGYTYGPQNLNLTCRINPKPVHQFFPKHVKSKKKSNNPIIKHTLAAMHMIKMKHLPTVRTQLRKEKNKKKMKNETKTEKKSNYVTDRKVLEIVKE
jgi:hypothetical protein